MIKQLIKKTQKNIEKRVKKTPNSMLAKVYMESLHLLRPFYFSDEFLMLNNLKAKSASTVQSILFFSVHKSASTFINNTVVRLYGPDKITSVNLSGYLASKKEQDKNYNNTAIMKKVLQKTGFFFGAFRAYYPFPDMGQYKVLLVLRDPRDVLTSYYYSTLFNHPLGRKDVFKERDEYADMTIDEFVLAKAEDFKAKYKDYCEHLLGKSNVLLLKYEDMITKFEEWLKNLSAFLGLHDNDNIIKEIVSETSFKVKKEDPNSFIRNIKAKDHLDKLKPETIKKLTDIFRNELVLLGYDVD